MEQMAHVLDRTRGWLAPGIDVLAFLSLSADCFDQVGFSVLATLPQSDLVYPLLGRPQDSLMHSQKDPR
jgi:hypothetical protein